MSFGNFIPYVVGDMWRIGVIDRIGTTAQYDPDNVIWFGSSSSSSSSGVIVVVVAMVVVVTSIILAKQFRLGNQTGIQFTKYV